MAFTYARRIAGYNRPLYIGAALAVTTGACLLFVPVLPFALKALCALGMAVALWYTAASFLAFHWMFDRSPLLSGSWLPATLPSPPRSWIQVNAGLEETTVDVGSVFPEAAGRQFDIFDAAAMTEPAVARAKLQQGSTASGATAACLPLETDSTDLVLVTLAAHELRDANTRTRFFLELKRVTSACGKVIVVEHLRNTAAALAFGPGMFHFYGRRHWLNLATETGLHLNCERALNPFVHVFVFSK